MHTSTRYIQPENDSFSNLKSMLIYICGWRAHKLVVASDMWYMWFLRTTMSVMILFIQLLGFSTGDNSNSHLCHSPYHQIKRTILQWWFQYSYYCAILNVFNIYIYIYILNRFNQSINRESNERIRGFPAFCVGYHWSLPFTCLLRRLQLSITASHVCWCPFLVAV